MSMIKHPDGSISVGILTDMKEPEIFTPKKPVVEEVKETVESPEAPKEKKKGRPKKEK